jgi:hypothetical protein
LCESKNARNTIKNEQEKLSIVLKQNATETILAVNKKFRTFMSAPRVACQKNDFTVLAPAPLYPFAEKWFAEAFWA